MILHLTSQKDWLEAQEQGTYTAPSLDAQGFIHCSTEAQILRVANAFYREMPDPVVLWIDPERLNAPLRWESPNPNDPLTGERFPHLYGPLNLDAVVRISELKRDADGVYRSI